MSTEMRGMLGWIIAGGGLITLLLGLCLGGLAIALQLMDPAGASNNLMGFAIVFGLCPLPLIVLGTALLGMGAALVYFARQS